MLGVRFVQHDFIMNNSNISQSGKNEAGTFNWLLCTCIVHPFPFRYAWEISYIFFINCIHWNWIRMWAKHQHFTLRFFLLFFNKRFKISLASLYTWVCYVIHQVNFIIHVLFVAKTEITTILTLLQSIELAEAEDTSA